MNEKLSYLHIVADNLTEMSIALKAMQSLDNWEAAVGIIVDMHINIAHSVRLLGLTNEEFARLANARVAMLKEKSNAHMIARGLVLPNYKGPADA